MVEFVWILKSIWEDCDSGVFGSVESACKYVSTVFMRKTQYDEKSGRIEFDNGEPTNFELDKRAVR